MAWCAVALMCRRCASFVQRQIQGIHKSTGGKAPCVSQMECFEHRVSRREGTGVWSGVRILKHQRLHPTGSHVLTSPKSGDTFAADPVHAGAAEITSPAGSALLPMPTPDAEGVQSKEGTASRRRTPSHVQRSAIPTTTTILARATRAFGRPLQGRGCGQDVGCLTSLYPYPGSGSGILR
eukprot:CAMPEP_0113666040 /NCGR_PEP_ID=MMETSP0038_2-20120614/2646_1 /TAXON_ID=2898 /ORGANISM="Cryptomonas paramecium" /LENGTH=179 /DNA_ID=CAMNT_0000581473 /DNA_START=302 /DNA_END=839 /DNA_ORIENTATION=- /assembly_acc=CAM_ASM_000170